MWRRIKKRIKFRFYLRKIVKKQSLINDIMKLTNSWARYKLNQLSVRELKKEKKLRLIIRKHGGM